MLIVLKIALLVASIALLRKLFRRTPKLTAPTLVTTAKLPGTTHISAADFAALLKAQGTDLKKVKLPQGA
jgi:hypothetical protein